jgi:hypothetical protein
MARDGKNSDLRASDAERDVVASELGQHFQDGRLDQAEFDERVDAALAAKTRGDLDALLADLPRGSVDQRVERSSQAEQIADSGAGPAHWVQPRVARGRPAVLALLPLLVAVAVLGGLFSGGWQHGWPFVPFGFLWLIVPILVARTWVFGRGRRQWR